MNKYSVDNNKYFTKTDPDSNLDTVLKTDLQTEYKERISKVNDNNKSEG